MQDENDEQKRPLHSYRRILLGGCWGAGVAKQGARGIVIGIVARTKLVLFVRIAVAHTPRENSI